MVNQGTTFIIFDLSLANADYSICCCHSYEAEDILTHAPALERNIAKHRSQKRKAAKDDEKIELDIIRRWRSNS
jgi:hypothetical protein